LAKSVFDIFGSTLNLKTVIKGFLTGTQKRQAGRQTEGQMKKRAGGQIERQRDGLFVRHMQR
jgi:hypothetical protein